MKKRQNDKFRKKTALQKGSFDSGFQYSGEGNKIYHARKYPVFECLINDSWRERGLAHILLSRQQPDGNIAFGVYLVDIFCLGLKNTFCNVNFPIWKYERRVKEGLSQHEHLVDCPVALAHQIIYGAIDYAAELGFGPQKDFKMSKYILDARSTLKDTEGVEFGKNGKPFFIPGSDDNAKLIVKKLEERLGEGNFHFLVGMR